MRFTIYGKLDGINSYTSACRTNPHKGAQVKKQNQELVEYFLNKETEGTEEQFPFENPVKLNFAWFEENNRRDPDNISGFGHKVILDAMVERGILQGDSRRYVKEFSDRFYTDKKNPRIEVEVVEIEQ